MTPNPERDDEPGARAGPEVETYRGVAYPWEMDHVGHLNVQFYVRRFDEASWHFLARLGLTPAYLRAHGRGVVAREQRVTYTREVGAGALLVARTRLLDVGRSSLRYEHVLYDVGDGEPGAESARMALHVVYFDTGARRSCPLPWAVAERARARLGVADPTRLTSGGSRPTRPSARCGGGAIRPS